MGPLRQQPAAMAGGDGYWIVTRAEGGFRRSAAKRTQALPDSETHPQRWPFRLDVPTSSAKE